MSQNTQNMTWLTGEWLFDTIMEHINPQLTTGRIGSLSEADTKKNAAKYVQDIVRCRNIAEEGVAWMKKNIRLRDERKSEREESARMRDIEISMLVSSDPFIV